MAQRRKVIDVPAGRPTLYREEYCEKVIEAANQGYSLTGFAGMIRVARSTINEWIDQFPEFSEAVSVAKGVRAMSWETRALNIGDGNGGPGAAGMVQFALKNLASDDWKDKSEQEVSGPNGGPVETKSTIDVRSLDPAARAALKAVLGKKGG
jgi:hypothetical protein